MTPTVNNVALLNGPIYTIIGVAKIMINNKLYIESFSPSEQVPWSLALRICRHSQGDRTLPNMMELQFTKQFSGASDNGKYRP